MNRYERSAAAARNIDELRRIAKRRLPRGFFEYIDRGAEDERALARNRGAFDRLAFTPRCFVDTSRRTTRTTLLGRELAAPLVIAPTAAAGLLWNDGERQLARAAGAAGIPVTLSTASIAPLEQVAEVGGDLWFQLYLYPDISMSLELVDRAWAAGYSTLVVTLDTTVSPNREYNARNGFHIPFRFSAHATLDAMCHPHWSISVVLRHLLSQGLPEFQNLPAQLRSDIRGRGRSASMVPKNEACSWDLLVQLRDRWKGKLVLKGILHPEDARLAIEHGVDGIVVSNHGGRNLDAVISPVEALPTIVAMVRRRMAVITDSGIRRGSDIAKAIALGADAVMVGRAPLWGVASGGQIGAARAIELLQGELTRVMAQVGVCSVQALQELVLTDFAGAMRHVERSGAHE